MTMKSINNQEGKLGTYLGFFLIGVPLPILLLVFLLRGCS